MRPRAQIIDRFLERQLVARSRLQLVGVTGLMLASKYEEIYPPEVHPPNRNPLGVAHTSIMVTGSYSFQPFGGSAFKCPRDMLLVAWNEAWVHERRLTLLVAHRRFATTSTSATTPTRASRSSRWRSSSSPSSSSASRFPPCGRGCGGSRKLLDAKQTPRSSTSSPTSSTSGLPPNPTPRVLQPKPNTLCPDFVWFAISGV